MANPEYRSIDWLLEAENPSVRYRTLTELLDRPLDSPEVCETKAQIADSKPVIDIFLNCQISGNLPGAKPSSTIS